jgi:hypothetical protein
MPMEMVKFVLTGFVRRRVVVAEFSQFLIDSPLNEFMH